MCKQLREQIQRLPRCSPEMIERGRLKVVALYPDEDLTEWREYATIFRRAGSTATMGCVVREKSLYDLHAIPALYLLDRDKRAGEGFDRCALWHRGGDRPAGDNRGCSSGRRPVFPPALRLFPGRLRFSESALSADLHYKLGLSSYKKTPLLYTNFARNRYLCTTPNRKLTINIIPIMAKKWRCTVCGYIHEGPEAPDNQCPMCKVGKKFVRGR